MAPLIIDPDALPEPSRSILDRLGERPWMDHFYLAGSPALNLYLRHRRTRALIFMGVDRLTSPRRRDLLGELKDLCPGIEVESATDGLLKMAPVAGGEGPVLRFFYYPYPLIDAEEEIGGVSVASALDLGLMKLAAIASRAARRDFVDLYLLCRRVPLAEMLERSPEKFGHVEDFPLQAFRGLADWSFAEADPMPGLHHPLEWQEVVDWLEGEVRALARDSVGLGS